MSYGDLRDLEHMAVVMHQNDVVDISGVLENKERYECFCEYVRCVLEPRRTWG